MQASKRVLAFDFGASGGRAMLAWLEEGGLRLQEVHRFVNQPVAAAGRLYWDVLRLFHELKQGMVKAQAAGGFSAVGIDTWGVDFGLLDQRGRLLQNPVHYRDRRTEGIMDRVFAAVSKEELYARTGIQCLRINTIYQLAALQAEEPQTLELARTLLLMPDLLAYLLTGAKRAEYTNVSTTNLLNCETGDWDWEIIRRLGLPDAIFPPLIRPGETYGTLLPEVCEETGCPPVPVLAVGSHDTASAVAALPTGEEGPAFLSSGTWSLFGAELSAPLLTRESAAANFTNEAGCGGTVRYLKNIMGLWLAQQCRAHWERQGQDVSYTLLDAETEAAAPFVSFIDPDHPRFELPGDLPARVRDYCRETGQPVPQGRGEVLRCIYQSLALTYRFNLEQLRRLTGGTYGTLYVIGGGIKDRLLCKMTASACGTPVEAGPAEATASGNAAAQLMALGELADWRDARRAVAAGAQITRYEPRDTDAWADAYDRFLKLVKQ